MTENKKLMYTQDSAGRWYSYERGNKENTLTPAENPFKLIYEQQQQLRATKKP